MLKVEISGAAKLHDVVIAVRAAGDKGMSKEMSAALRKAAKPVQESLRKTTEASMPSRGGYRAVLSKSLRFRTNIQAGPRSVAFRLITFADGTAERRDIVALNNGKLRHPVFGRSRAGERKGERVSNPWAVTTIEGGFFARGTKDAAGLAEKEMLTVLDEYAAKLGGEG